MAQRYDDRFNYASMASIVQKQDRSAARRDEPTGEAERVTTEQLKSVMGSALRSSVPSQPKAVASKKAKPASAATAPEQINANEYDDMMKMGGAYVPSSKVSEKAWEKILTKVQSSLPDVARDVLRSAAEEVLAVLKNREIADTRIKKQKIEFYIGHISDEDYRFVAEASDAIQDFNPAALVATTSSSKDGGVAVVFEDEEGDEDAESGGEVEAEVQEVSDEENDQHGEVSGGGGLRLQAASSGLGEAAKDDYFVPAHSIDAYWLQRQVAQTALAEDGPADASTFQQLAEEALVILATPEDSARENELVALLGFARFELVKRLLKNRAAVLFCTKLHRAGSAEERSAIEREMFEDLEGRRVFAELRGEGQAGLKGPATSTKSTATVPAEATNGRRPSARTLDLNLLAVRHDARSVGDKVVLPKGSWRRTDKSHEEVHVRPLKPKDMQPGEVLVKIAELPAWMRPAFAGMEQLNRIQSRVYKAVVPEDQDDRFNMLVCAPTGAGKTNVAVLAVLNEVRRFVKDNDVIDSKRLKEQLKIVYVAPMKALVQEVVLNLGGRFSAAPFEMQVRELSGDQQLSKSELEATQIIVTTPEKWDVVTRKAGDRAYTQFVRLVIVDEIHLLHDVRGAVLEAVIARTLRASEECREPVRILGISATLPNFEDVATFLRVPVDKGLFFFDNSFRPVPLLQVYVGVTERKAINRLKATDLICYDKVRDSAQHNQVLVFVHSRKDTVKTAKFIRDRATELEQLQDFLPAGSTSREILSRMSAKEVEGSAKSGDLQDLLPYGFAVHNAGLARADRTLVEDLFAAGHVRVLVSTATLAWGVNLPAHTVVIKGTQVYSPELGRWTELSQLDVLQMLGRAGRPQFDKEGEGIIITTHSEMQFYLSLLNQQLPIESQLLKHLPDHLNAEVASGAVQSLDDAARWLAYTYLYVRMLRVPDKYGVIVDDDDDDEQLLQWRIDLAHAACLILDKAQLIRYDRRSGTVQGTPLGRIASYYYLSPSSMQAFASLLEPTAGDVEFLRILAAAEEFKQITVRQEEKLELSKLLDHVPVPIKEPMDDPAAKINALLQAYISKAALEGYALACDLVYVHQSAGRISRALFEICMQRGWAGAARRCLDVCTMVDRQLWRSQSPLRQFKKALSEEMFRQLEKKNIPWAKYFDLTAVELGALVRQPRLGQTLHKLIHRFPRLEVEWSLAPLTRTILRIDLTVKATFEFDPELLGPSMLFWITVEDGDGESLLHSEPYLLKARFADEEHVCSMVVSLPEPVPPFMFCRISADRFLHARTSVAIPLSNVVLPPKVLPPTELLDLQPVAISTLKDARLLPSLQTHLWPTQTQALPALREQDGNVLFCAPTGQALCADLAILRAFEVDAEARVVYIAPLIETCSKKFADWSQRFGPDSSLGKTVVMLEGDDGDVKRVEEAHLVVALARHWELISRRWNQKKFKVATEVSLMVFDNVHMLGDERGGTAMEVSLSRARYASAQLSRPLRIVALGQPIANVEDIAAWMDAKHATFNFAPGARPNSLEILIRGFVEQHFESRVAMMSRPTYKAIAGLGLDFPALVFAPTRRQCRLAAVDMVTYATAEGKSFSPCPEGEIDGIKDEGLKASLRAGVGYLHEGLSLADRGRVQELFVQGQVHLLVTTYSMVWALHDDVGARLVVLLGTSTFDGKARAYVEYPLPDVLEMVSRASKDKAQVLVLCHEPRKELYKRFLYQAMPVESRLARSAPDVLLAEFAAKTVQTKQDCLDWLTWTLLYRRLVHNPAFYSMQQGGSGSQAISEHLSELVDAAVSDLQGSHCLGLASEDSDVLLPLNLGMIAAHYDVKCSTVELFDASLQPKTKLKGILEILSSASEYLSAGAPRPKEEPILERLSRHLKYPLATSKLSEAHVKVNVLLQAHFSRAALAPEQREDLAAVLMQAPRLLQAMVDVASSRGLLKPMLLAVELCQMCVQGLWVTDSPVKQVPTLDTNTELFAALQAKGVESVPDLADHNDFLQQAVDPATLARIAQFCNAYPSLELSASIAGQSFEGEVTLAAGVPREVQVKLTREGEASDVMGRLPMPKSEVWWLVLGDMESNTLLAIKKVTVEAELAVKLKFDPVPDASSIKLKLYLLCDSYLGCDQELSCDLVF